MNTHVSFTYNLAAPEQAIILLAGIIFTSLIIERILEVVKSIYDLLEVKYGWYQYWNRKAQKLQEQFDDALSSSVVENLSQAIGDNKSYLRNVVDQSALHISVAEYKKFYIKVVMKIVAMLLGIGIVCLFFPKNSDLFFLIQQSIYGSNAPHTTWPILANIVTGAFIGLGAEAVHKIIFMFEILNKKRK